MSQFGEWLVEGLQQSQMDELMQLLLTRMMSDTSQVQLAATNCISVLVEKGEEKLVGYYDAIIKAVSQCFGFYGVGHGADDKT